MGCVLPCDLQVKEIPGAVLFVVFVHTDASSAVPSSNTLNLIYSYYLPYCTFITHFFVPPPGTKNIFYASGAVNTGDCDSRGSVARWRAAKTFFAMCRSANDLPHPVKKICAQNDAKHRRHRSKRSSSFDTHINSDNNHNAFFLLPTVAI